MPGPTAHPLRPVTADEVAAFERDGVVHLPAILPAVWIDHLVDPVEAAIADPVVTTDMTALQAAVSGTPLDPDKTGRFLSGVDHWLHDPAFAYFATASPLPAIAGALLNADRIHLYEDSVLVKEPGTTEATTLHQDLGYFHLTGDRICTTWVPSIRWTSRPAPWPTSAGPTDQAWSTAPTGSCPMSPYPDPKGCPYLRSQMTTPASCAIPSNRETSSYTMRRRSTVPGPTARPAPEDEPFPSGTAGTASTIWSGPALPPRPTTLPTATSGQATRW